MKWYNIKKGREKEVKEVKFQELFALGKYMMGWKLFPSEKNGSKEIV
jgi:hypothetical protein